MGSKDSKQKAEYGQMHIEIAQTLFTAGDTIKGTVHL